MEEVINTRALMPLAIANNMCRKHPTPAFLFIINMKLTFYIKNVNPPLQACGGRRIKADGALPVRHCQHPTTKKEHFIFPAGCAKI
ncbi:MAG: hypothetical protein HZB82_02030 [Deltaproteobacteria bacterium]|nr:hypothetical protein [Deltaproteobacteria bacterium]